MSIYYTGKNGVYNYGGKDYKFGDELPADIPAETVEAFMAKGKMSTTRPTADAPPAPSEVELLKARVTELVTEATVLTHQLAAAKGDLDAATLRITELEGKITLSVDEGVALLAKNNELSADLQTAQQTITELTNQLTAGPGKGGRK